MINDAYVVMLVSVLRAMQLKFATEGIVREWRYQSWVVEQRYCGSHSHIPRHQRAPSDTSVWLQHTHEILGSVTTSLVREHNTTMEFRNNNPIGMRERKQKIVASHEGCAVSNPKTLSWCR